MTDQTKEAPAPSHKSTKPTKEKPRTGLAELVSDLFAAGVNSEQILIVIQFFEARRRHCRRGRGRRRRGRGGRCCGRCRKG